MNPVKNYVKVSLEDKEKKTEGGLVLPNSSFRKKNVGVVVAPETSEFFNKEVLFLRDDKIEEVQEQNVPYVFLPESNIIAVNENN